MGLLSKVLDMFFGGDRNVLRETAEVFRENSEAGAQRDFDQRAATLAQFAAEFARQNRGGFDRLMDGVNRLPRPLMALGCLLLFGAAMVDPLWFAARMQGIALVPEPLWWLLGVIVSFYFGARHQAKGQDFQRDMLRQIATSSDVIRQMQTAARQTEEESAGGVGKADNPALEEWRRAQ